MPRSRRYRPDPGRPPSHRRDPSRDAPSEWEPVVTAVVAAATSGHIPTELADHLDERGATTGWAALVAALRRVLAGDRDREQLLAGLDDIDAAILTAVLDRLPTSPGQDT